MVCAPAHAPALQECQPCAQNSVVPRQQRMWAHVLPQGAPSRPVAPVNRVQGARGPGWGWWRRAGVGVEHGWAGRGRDHRAHARRPPVLERWRRKLPVVARGPPQQAPSPCASSAGRACSLAWQAREGAWGYQESEAAAAVCPPLPCLTSTPALGPGSWPAVLANGAGGTRARGCAAVQAAAGRVGSAAPQVRQAQQCGRRPRVPRKQRHPPLSPLPSPHRVAVRVRGWATHRVELPELMVPSDLVASALRSPTGPSGAHKL